MAHCLRYTHWHQHLISVLTPDVLPFIPIRQTVEQSSLLANRFITVRPEIIVFQPHDTNSGEENRPEVILQNPRQVIERIEGGKKSGMHQPQVRLDVAAHTGKGYERYRRRRKPPGQG